jgi:hypothetical protein
MTDSSAQSLIAFVERIRAERTYWSNQKWTTPEEPPDNLRPEHYKLRWRPGYAAYQPAIPLEEARTMIQQRMTDYLQEKRTKDVLLVRAQPGVGKTHTAVEVVQEMAREGKRILYAMPTHAHFDTLADLEHWDNPLWYHWMALTAINPETGNSMCLYPRAMERWTQKGYPAMKLCDGLCQMFKSDCAYRQQRLRAEPIIAGVHNHVAMGMQIDDFDAVIIDELPLSAFLQPRHIPRDGLLLSGAGPVTDLSQTLSLLVSELVGGLRKGRLQGKALLDEIGPILDDVYAQFDDYQSALPTIPWVNKPEDVEKAAWWYLPDLLMLLVREKSAWEAGMKHWLERVMLTKNGLDLLMRADPWQDLPRKVIILDATGSTLLYKQLFNKDVELCAPMVQRKGKVFQVVGRLNGISTFLNGKDDKRGISKQAKEALVFCQEVIRRNDYQQPGAVTFKAAVPEFEEIFGVGRVLHFYGQRGSNDLIDVDALFVVGTPQPPNDNLMQMVAALWPQRVKPFAIEELDGQIWTIVRSSELRQYQYFDERGQAERLVGGFWNDPELNILADVLREQELLQAVHRARPITRETPVWLISAIPTSEPLDKLFEDYGGALDVPEEIPNWQAWLKLITWLSEAQQRGEAVTYSDISQITGIPEATVRKRKWLDVILKVFPDLWTTSEIQPAGGRAPRGITPIYGGTVLFSATGAPLSRNQH